MTDQPTGVDNIEAELDARLISVWTDAWQVDGWDLELVGPFLRLAYGIGYRDGLTESRRGVLYRTLGLPVPRRKRS